MSRSRRVLATRFGFAGLSLVFFAVRGDLALGLLVAAFQLSPLALSGWLARWLRRHPPRTTPGRSWHRNYEATTDQVVREQRERLERERAPHVDGLTETARLRTELEACERRRRRSTPDAPAGDVR